MKIILFLLAVGCLFRGIDFLGLAAMLEVEKEEKTAPVIYGVIWLIVGGALALVAANV